MRKPSTQGDLPSCVCLLSGPFLLPQGLSAWTCSVERLWVGGISPCATETTVNGGLAPCSEHAGGSEVSAKSTANLSPDLGHSANPSPVWSKH